ncbi:MAG TPA: hypothetical protein VKG61_00930 [Streptosporangiaceae bacterium]|nr:hypothetical protein [Streptosporangiaceae bacterium]
MNDTGMNDAGVSLDAVRRIADAVLYEGYILYPYRASSQKNRSRWQFGVVMAPGYAAVDPSESSVTQSEWVLEHSGQPTVQVILRFLQVQRRSTEGAASFQGGAWDEAMEREIEFTAGPEDLLGPGLVREFSVPGGEDREPSPDAAIVVRRREPLAGLVCVRTTPVPGPWRAVRLQVRVENRTAAEPAPAIRDDALPTALVAAHVIATVSGGDFISMTDPPEWAKPAVAECQNTGVWPVLADPDGGRKVVLASPIILYDHPELAPESPGELYDGTEIDEILTLRTLALSDEEKLEARATDPRAAALIDRVEAMDAPTMERLHGTIRALRPGASGAGRPAAPGSSTSGAGHSGTSGAGHSGASGAGGFPADYDPSVPWWDPEADASVSPDTDSVLIAGQQVARGSLVRLRPGKRRADAQDMFLAGRVAEVQAVLLDVEDQPYLAVALTDHPDPELSIAHGRFLYFMPDEVEPCEGGTA